MKTETLHKLVGACVIGGVVVLSAFWMGQKSHDVAADGYSLTASFSKIDGVTIGSEVLLAGISIGSVVSESLDPDSHQVTLTLRIDPSVELPYDSVAKITSDGIFGGKYISVDVGGEYEMLEDGDAFEFIQDSIIFEDVFEKVIELGESGLKKRKEASKALDTKSNPFATDPSLLTPKSDVEETEDIFEEDFEEDLETTEESKQPLKADEGEGPV